MTMPPAAPGLNAVQAQDLETIFHTLSQAIDTAGAGQEQMFLTRLALLAYLEIGDAGRFAALIDEAGA